MMGEQLKQNSVGSSMGMFLSPYVSMGELPLRNDRGNVGGGEYYSP